MNDTRANLAIGLACIAGWAMPIHGQSPTEAGDRTHIARRVSPSESAQSNETESADARRLKEILRRAQVSLQFCRREIRDYTCTLISQERIDGRLHPPKRCYAKVRHHRPPNPGPESPVSVYLHFDAPRSVEGREILLVNGKNDGKMLVRAGGTHLAFLTTLIDPTGPLAMHDTRYSIHEFGVERLVERLIEYGTDELHRGGCRVTMTENVEMDDRTCTVYQLVNPNRDDHLPYHQCKVYVDEALKLPVRFEAYDWPTEVDGEPVPMELYLYKDLEFNVGLTDEDFEATNPAYRFQ